MAEVGGRRTPLSVLARNPGSISMVAALLVLVVGGFAGLPMLLTFLVAFGLIVAGAAVVNGAYVLRQLLVVIPTLVLVTAFTL